jgi:hypothetical protein
MSKVKVWNDSERDYYEEFKNYKIHIPGKSFIELPRSDGVALLGTFSGGRRDEYGRFINEKALRLEFDHEAEAERTDQPLKYKCELTGEMFRTIQGLEKHQARVNSQLAQENEEKQNVKRTKVGKSSGGSKQPIL